MAARHSRRHDLLENSCKRLLLPGEPLVLWPMYAWLDLERVQAVRKSLNHSV